MERLFSIEELIEFADKGNYSGLRTHLIEFNSVDIAEFIQELEDDQIVLVFRVLPKDISAEVFSYLDSDYQEKIVKAITDKELGALVKEMFLDDAVDFLEEVPANVVKRVLSATDAKTRREINTFLNYPDNSAGSIMTNEMVEIHDRFTVSQAIEQIRKTGVDKETIYTCYCIDNRHKLVGTVELRDLIFNESDVPVRDIMDDDQQLIYVNTHDDQEDVVELVKKYDLLTIPVTDNENRLVGIITIDDVVDIIEEENTEDFQGIAGVQPSEEVYLKTGVFTLAKNRILWLFILMMSATITGQIIQSFESMLSAITGLTAAIPMLMGTGGNAGNQASTIIIRNLALGEVTAKDFFKVFFKEFRVSIICGAFLAVANVGRMLLMKTIFGSPGDLLIYIVVSLALFFAVILAKLLGCALPILAKVLRLDPALMAGPMITTLVDAFSLVIYFSLARAILPF